MSHKSDSSKAAEWRRRLRRFKASDLSVAKFCAAEKCSEPSFYYWRKKLAGTDTTERSSSRPAAFHQLSLPRLSAISIELPGGALVNVSGDNLEALRTIVREAIEAGRLHDEGGQSC